MSRSGMGVLLASEKAGSQQQASLMLNEQSGKLGGGSTTTTTCVQLEPEPPLPYGWEKCLDLKSGVVYFKDWNTGVQMYRDPRRNSNLLRFDHRIGHLSISLQTKTPSEIQDVAAAGTTTGDQVLLQGHETRAKAAAGNSSDDKTKSSRSSVLKALPGSGLRLLPLELAIGRQSAVADEEEDASDRDSHGHDHHSLRLSLNPPGANCSQEHSSVCTVEKVQNALKWSQCGGGGVSLSARRTSLALRSRSPPAARPSSSRESNSPGPVLTYSEASSKLRSITPGSLSLSQCSSECLTSSPSTRIHQGNEEDEVQQLRSFGEPTTTPLEFCRKADKSAVAATTEDQAVDQVLLQDPEDAAVMVAVGCKSCLMYIMLPKLHPSCPKCGNADVLLDLPSPMHPKKRQ